MSKSKDEPWETVVENSKWLSEFVEKKENQARRELISEIEGMLPDKLVEQGEDYQVVVKNPAHDVINQFKKKYGVEE